MSAPPRGYASGYWQRRDHGLIVSTVERPGFEPYRRGDLSDLIGEPQRAFYGGQFGLTFPVFVHYSIGLWVPEVGGKVDPGSDAHELVMSLYGGMSKGERNRIKTRVRTAMAAQAAIEGRFLGGRPPYGYVLGDAGEHPNPAKAAIGQRLHVLEVDPTAAPVVQRIFSDFISGKGFYAIAESLTRDEIPSPSAHDPKRNRHRTSSNGAWSKQAIRAILQNPRYTGFQVWNKQRRDEVLIDVDDVALGHESKMRWNDQSEWVRSEVRAHEPIITDEDFATIQDILIAGKRTAKRKARTRHPYLLSGLMRCGVCGRKMQASWNNNRAYYRCKFPAEYAVSEDKHPKTVYVREDAVLPGLDGWLGQLFDDEHIDDTCEALIAASQAEPDDQSDRELVLMGQLKACDTKLSKYRRLLETQDDIAVVGTWIAEVEAERRKIEAELNLKPKQRTLTKPEVRALVSQLRDLANVLANASLEDRRAVYD